MKATEDIKAKIDVQYNKMVDFRDKHDLKTDPMKTLYEWATYIVIERKGYCPCNGRRPKCPCKEALSEIKEKGKCFCGQFFTPEKFKEIWKHRIPPEDKEK